MNITLVQTTCVSKAEAKNIAKVLIDSKLAACVQLSEIESFYNWHDEFCCDNEILVSIKTKKEDFDKVKSKIKEHHSYDVPEIIEIDISNSSKKYLKFIEENTK
ncbi:divalent-cation tolerance protein CutA [Poseidonibacter parvus]|uniref:Divalent-cation tolerance protein CutA n=1 Tax=Poseidonibacter parvus TaxID=1850254 RepID=A0A1P8KJ32_9BACT|nr:divalent-cation tolerance protein CutA [Poseidonibacter parvus]APW64559.1 divalent-cation tolerance protein CutA [Poseidonibacter parvus]